MSSFIFGVIAPVLYKVIQSVPEPAGYSWMPALFSVVFGILVVVLFVRGLATFTVNGLFYLVGAALVDFGRQDYLSLGLAIFAYVGGGVLWLRIA